MRWLKRWLVAAGLLFAYLVLFLGGTAALGPGGRDALAPAEQSTALAMTLVVALLDMALFHTWLVRASDRGWRLWFEAFVVFYGIKTFSSQLEVWYFVQTSVVPVSMLPRLFAMTLPVAVGWTGLAVWAWGPQHASAESAPSPVGPLRVFAAGALLYPLLFFSAGYFIAWQNPTLRAYYGGPEQALPFFVHYGQMFRADPWVLPFEMARGLLWLAIGWPLLRRTRGPWWVGGLLFAGMLAVVQNDLHLLPNPLMPREVRVWHLVETASSNFLFGLGAAALVAPRGALGALFRAAHSRGWMRPLDRWLAGLSLPLEALLALGGLVGGALLFLESQRRPHPARSGLPLRTSFPRLRDPRGGALPRQRRDPGCGGHRAPVPQPPGALVGPGVGSGAGWLDERSARVAGLPVLAAGGVAGLGAGAAGVGWWVGGHHASRRTLTVARLARFGPAGRRNRSHLCARTQHTLDSHPWADSHITAPVPAPGDAPARRSRLVYCRAARRPTSRSGRPAGSTRGTTS